MPSKWNLMLPSVMDVALTLNTWYSIVLTYGQPVDVMGMQRDACNGVKWVCTLLQVRREGDLNFRLKACWWLAGEYDET